VGTVESPAGTAPAATAPAGTAPAGIAPAGPYRDELVLLRSQLTNLRALLVLSILMTESADDQQILRLATSALSVIWAAGRSPVS
jgi:hypothetical protein